MWTQGRLTGVALFGYLASLLLIAANPATPVPLTVVWVFLAMALVADLALAPRTAVGRLISGEAVLLVVFFLFTAISMMVLPEESRLFREQWQLLLVSLGVMAYVRIRGDFLHLEAAYFAGLVLVFSLLAAQGHLLSPSAEQREAATLGNANSYAFYLAVGALLALRRLTLPTALPLSRPLAWFRNLALVGFAGLAGMQIVFATGSRKGVVALALVIASFYGAKVLRLPKSRLLPSLAVVAVALMASASVIRLSPYYDRLATLFTAKTDYQVESSFQTRESMRAEALEMWRQKPLLGWGTDQFRYRAGFFKYSHSNFAELLANNGLLGFSLYYGIYLLMMIKLINLWRVVGVFNAPDKEYWGLVFLSTGTLVLLGWNFGAVTYVDKSAWIYTGILVGMINAARDRLKGGVRLVRA